MKCGLPKQHIKKKQYIFITHQVSSRLTSCRSKYSIISWCDTNTPDTWLSDSIQWLLVKVSQSLHSFLGFFFSAIDALVSTHCYKLKKHCCVSQILKNKFWTLINECYMFLQEKVHHFNVLTHKVNKSLTDPYYVNK